MARMQTRTTKSGKRRWIVKWIDEGVDRSRSFRVYADAKSFKAEVELSPESHSARREREAQEEEARLDRELNFAVIAERWNRHIGMGLAESTRVKQAATVNQIIKRFGMFRIDRITADEITRWIYDELTPRYAPATAHQKASQLSRIFTYAVDTGLLDRSPFRLVKMPNRGEPRHVYLTHAQAKLIIEKTRWADDKLVVELLIFTGLRWGELVGLRVSDFDRPHRTLLIERSVSELRGVLTEGPTKTRHSRLVGVPQSLARKIEEHITKRGLKPDDILFPSKISRGWRYNPSARDSWFHAAVRACVEVDETFPADLTPHGLRHAAASFMIRAGLSVSDVQAQMGHRAATTTLNVYADLWRDSPSVVGSALEGLLDDVGTEVTT